MPSGYTKSRDQSGIDRRAGVGVVLANRAGGHVGDKQIPTRHHDGLRTEPECPIR